MPFSISGTPLQSVNAPRVTARNGAVEGHGLLSDQNLQESPSAELGAGPLFGNPPGTALLNHRPIIQKKLEVGSPDDPLEQEADQMADQVVHRMALGAAPPPLSPSKRNESSIQRQCADCEQDEVVQAKFESPSNRIQTKGISSNSAVSPHVSSQIFATKGGGQTLPPPLLTHMQSGFGQELSSVRIHTDGQAANLSRDLNAKAFTVGRDIYFGQGQFEPNTKSGQHLLAHELTHTIQQSNQIRRAPDSEPSSEEKEKQAFIAEKRRFEDSQKEYFDELGGTMVGQIMHSAGFAENTVPTTPADAEKLITFWGLSMATIVAEMAAMSASLTTQVVGKTTTDSLAKMQADFIAALSPKGQLAYTKAIELVKKEPYWNSFFASNEVYVFPDLGGSNRFSGYNQTAKDPDDPLGHRKIVIVHLSKDPLEADFPEASASTLVHELSHTVNEVSIIGRSLSDFRKSMADLLVDHPDILATRTGATDPDALKEEQRKRLSQILYEKLGYGEEEIFVHLQQLTHQPDVGLMKPDGTTEWLRGAQYVQREVLRYVENLKRIGLEPSVLKGILDRMQRRVDMVYDDRIAAQPKDSTEAKRLEANKKMARLLFDLARSGDPL